MADVASSEQLYERTGADVDKTFARVDGMWHALLPEDSDLALLAQAVGWMRERLGDGRGAGA